MGVLRRFKEELYDYVITNNPTKHMRVAGIEDERLKDEDLVLAIGNISDFGMKGLKGVTSEELYADILLDDITFSVDDIITEVFPKLLKQNGNSFPVNKFISKSTKEIPSYVYDAVKNNF